MPTTLTLKNIPDDVYALLKVSAATNRRSMNNEAIVCFEKALAPAKTSHVERLKGIREFRATLLPQGPFLAEDMDAMKHEGRP